MPRRSRAREVALQVLYREDLNPGDDRDADRRLLESRLRSERLVEFAAGLIEGVRGRPERLDEAIQQAAQNWDLHRMAATDRNILRLGAYELFDSDTPGPVVVDEAVELAKRYGSARSAGFVNGILDRLLQQAEGNAEGTGASEE